MKGIAVALVGFDRPILFQQDVDSIDAQHSPPRADYHVFLDGGIKARQDELAQIGGRLSVYPPGYVTGLTLRTEWVKIRPPPVEARRSGC